MANLIWVDLEMTGLNVQTDFILEMAVVITDDHLNRVAEGPVLVIHQPDSVLQAMDEWNQHHHSVSGLVERVRHSTLDERHAEQDMLAFVRQYVAAKESPMCGNSICQDRRFLARFMPELESFFHYRNLDVSTIKELAMRWRPELLSGLKKQSRHQALEDIHESIEELRYYRQHWLSEKFRGT